MFEVEFRGTFNREKFNSLKKFLDKNAENLGEDNKNCHFYVFSDKMLKLVKNTSKKTAKISLKLNRIGKGSLFPEHEVYFDPRDFKKVALIFDKLLSSAKKVSDSQKRNNYSYKDCGIALKYSNNWGYHIEIEQLIDNKEKHKKAKKQIREIADELGVTLMSEKELKKFTREIVRKQTKQEAVSNNRLIKE